MAYRLWRQDDNGQRALMATFADRATAEAQATAFEARAHKQLYWVEDDGVEGDGVEGDGVERDGVEGDGVERDGVEGDGVEGDGVERDGVKRDGA